MNLIRIFKDPTLFTQALKFQATKIYSINFNFIPDMKEEYSYAQSLDEVSSKIFKFRT